MKYIITVVLTLSVLWQGGFSDMAWLICGITASIFLIIKKFRVLPPMPVNICFASLICAYLLSVLLNGSRIEGWIGTAKIIIIFLWLILLYNNKFDIEQAILISGMIAAVTGILAYCGLLPIAGIFRREDYRGHSSTQTRLPYILESALY